MAAAELLADSGVLLALPCAEWNASVAVGLVGGCAVLPWRGAWLAASAAGLRAVPGPDELPASVAQAVVHVQKSRSGTWADLVAAWQALQPGGRLVVVGGNELGIATTCKRLAGQLGQSPQLLANRARARAVAFQRDAGPGPQAPAATAISVPAIDGPLALDTVPGVFSAEQLDPGSALLLDHLEVLDRPRRVVDLGAGCGVLALAAARRWPDCAFELLEADHRAVDCARRNAERLAPGRLAVAWWDAQRDPPPAAADAVLCNPPFHSGKAVDLGPARAMFHALAACLGPGGRALVVANRQLPYEADLASMGDIAAVATRDGFKLLQLTRG